MIAMNKGNPLAVLILSGMAILSNAEESIISCSDPYDYPVICDQSVECTLGQLIHRVDDQAQPFPCETLRENITTWKACCCINDTNKGRNISFQSRCDVKRRCTAYGHVRFDEKTVMHFNCAENVTRETRPTTTSLTKTTTALAVTTESTEANAINCVTQDTPADDVQALAVALGTALVVMVIGGLLILVMVRRKCKRTEKGNTIETAEETVAMEDRPDRILPPIPLNPEAPEPASPINDSYEQLSGFRPTEGDLYSSLNADVPEEYENIKD